MVEAIDDLARKVESVQNVVSDLARRGSVSPFAGVVPPTSQAGSQGSSDAA